MKPIISAKSMNIPAREEWREQADVFLWAELNVAQYPEVRYLNGSLNGVRLTIGQAAKARRCGMKKGFPDINLPVKRGSYSGLFIELKPMARGMKNPRRPGLDPDQDRWLRFLNSQGYFTATCYGSKAAIDLIESYLTVRG